MSGLIAAASTRSISLDRPKLEACIDPLDSMVVNSAATERSFLLASQHDYAPIVDICFFENQNFSAIVSGDVVRRRSLDWNAIHNDLISGPTSCRALQALRGAYSIALFDKLRERLFVVTDPYAWQAVYASHQSGRFVASTSIATFLNIDSQPPPVNEDWVYESIYFNYGLRSTAPLSGIERLPPATVTCYDAKGDLLNRWQYRDDTLSPTARLTGKAAVREAIDVFTSVVPDYIPDGPPSIVSLSAGLDCRAILASIPPELLPELHSFSFGLRDTSEILECDRIAARMGFQHLPVYLDNEFLRRLPTLASETVFLSGGEQNINRSHLLHVYSALNRDGRSYTSMLTGVSGDHIFRDHMRGYGNVPHIISEDMAAQFRNGRTRIDGVKYREILGPAFPRFEERIEYVLDQVSGRYGDYDDPLSYMCYLMYEAGPRYFGGQLAIANLFTSFRSPYWDPDIVRLGFCLEDATPGLSERFTSKDSFREARIQASVVAASTSVGNIPYHDMPVEVFARSNRVEYQVRRASRKLRTIVGRRQPVRGEDWPLWYETVMRDELARLFRDDSRIREYVSPEFIRESVETSDVHWLGKLATAELALRFAENRWQRLTDC